MTLFVLEGVSIVSRKTVKWRGYVILIQICCCVAENRKMICVPFKFRKIIADSGNSIEFEIGTEDKA